MNYSQNGDKFIYPIYVENKSSYTDTNIVTVIQALPAGIAYDSHTNNQGSFHSGTLTWTIPSLAGKTGTYLYLKVVVTDYTSGPFTITYSSSGTLIDANADDNEKSLEATFLVCSPSGGGVPDFSGCLCIDVSTNDTKCTIGDTEWRLNEESVVNSTTYTWDTDTGKGAFTPIDPTLAITGTYDLWCVQGVDNHQVSCNIAFTIYPQLEDKNIFDHTISTVPYGELSLDDVAVLELQYPLLVMADYCWRVLRNANGDATSGEAVDCNDQQDTKLIKFCSDVDCEEIVNNCPECSQNQLPADIQALLAALVIAQDYEPQLGDIISVQHPNASSDYEYKVLGWTRTSCDCVWKVSQDVDNLLILGSDSAPYIAAIDSIKAVEHNTAGVGSPNIILASETGKVFTNKGATALNYHTLPTAALGLNFTFVVMDNDGLTITANTGDIISINGIDSSSAGTATSSNIGSVVTLVAVDTTSWVAISSLGSWLLA